jgi:hypothetical protein
VTLDEARDLLRRVTLQRGWSACLDRGPYAEMTFAILRITSLAGAAVKFQNYGGPPAGWRRDPDVESGERTGWRRWNGGRECDMDDGPCACGSWHSVDESRVFAAPIWRATFPIPEGM